MTSNMRPLEAAMTQLNNQLAQKDCIGITICGVLQPIKLKQNVTYQLYLQSFLCWEDVANVTAW